MENKALYCMSVKYFNGMQIRVFQIYQALLLRFIQNCRFKFRAYIPVHKGNHENKIKMFPRKTM